MPTKPKKGNKIKVCFPIMNRVHYARQKHLLELLNRHPRIELQLVVGGSVLLDKYGEKFLPAMKEAGFRPAESLFNVIEGGTHITMAKTAGLTALEFSNALHKLNPDVVLVRGDRFEQLAIAMSAAYLNKTIAHIEGGDVTGTIDESVRHAITKLSHLHFVTNEAARARVVQMGENPKKIFNVGSPDIEYASKVKKSIDAGYFNAKIGVGAEIDFAKPFIMVMQHPVTTESGNDAATTETLKAIEAVGAQAIWFWPNNDAGTNDVAKTIRRYREKNRNGNIVPIRFVTDVLPEDFIALLREAAVLVGNSSAGIKEGAYLGTPVVNIGTRQLGRLRGPNVSDVPARSEIISRAIKKQLAHGYYPSSLAYFQPDTSRKIVEILIKNADYYQKKFYDKS